MKFKKGVYPPNIMDVINNAMYGVKYCSPPKVMFVPDKKTLRTMIKTVLKYGHEPLQVFYLRFGMINRDVLDMAEESFDLPIEKDESGSEAEGEGEVEGDE
jgi:hypothetical protein